MSTGARCWKRRFAGLQCTTGWWGALGDSFACSSLPSSSPNNNKRALLPLLLSGSCARPFVKYSVQAHASALAFQPQVLNDTPNARQALATTPRRPDYFKLPSLNLSKTAATQGNVGKLDLVHKTRSTAGSQTARDVRKIAMARDSIVNSLRIRMESGAQTAR